MATNPPHDKGRTGAVKSRSQVYSSQNKQKKNRFTDQYFKKDTPFKVVTKKVKHQGKKINDSR